MSYKNWNLKGCMLPIITPFKDDYSVDKEGLKKLVNYYIEDEKVTAIVPCGTTGESPTLNHEEDMRVTALCVDIAKGRVPVIAGTGSNATDEAIMLTRAAKEIGADAALVVTPYYNKPTQGGLYARLAELQFALDAAQ